MPGYGWAKAATGPLETLPPNPFKGKVENVRVKATVAAGQDHGP